MFARRMFAGRMFAPRFFPQSQGDVPGPGPGPGIGGPIITSVTHITDVT